MNVEDEALGISRDGAAQEFLRRREGFRANAVAPQGTGEGDPEGCIVIDDANPCSVLGRGPRQVGIRGRCHATSDSRYNPVNFRSRASAHYWTLGQVARTPSPPARRHGRARRAPLVTTTPFDGWSIVSASRVRVRF